MKYERFYAKIDLDAIGRNVAGVRQKIPADVKIMAVIKADGYGHGAYTLAEYLADKADWFGVATVDEALELRRSGCDKPILILGFVNPAEYAAVVAHDVTIAMFSLEDAKQLSLEALRQNKTAGVHIKVDTGMSRIGFAPTKASAEAVFEISRLPGIAITGLFSHFAKADYQDKSAALLQRRRYDEFVSLLSEKGVTISLKHLNNSAGIMELDQYYDMVRMGIMLYGLYPSDEMDRSYPLYPAMELITHVSCVKTVEKGTGVSYGHTYVAEKSTVVATIPVGYADGYPRCLSGRGAVLIGGQRCPILGRVCMDQMMIDVSEVPGGVREGDRVVIMGRDGDAEITAEELGDAAYSFNYELVTGISARVPRVYYRDGKYLKTVSRLR